MEESILQTIKQMLGIIEDDTAFDAELVSHINNSIAEMTQIGFGPDDGYLISGQTNVWSELVSNPSQMSTAKQYIFCKVRLLFDPPSNSFLCDALNKAKEEAYWRLYMFIDQQKEN